MGRKLVLIFLDLFEINLAKYQNEGIRLGGGKEFFELNLIATFFRAPSINVVLLAKQCVFEMLSQVATQSG